MGLLGPMGTLDSLAFRACGPLEPFFWHLGFFGPLELLGLLETAQQELAGERARSHRSHHRELKVRVEKTPGAALGISIGTCSKDDTAIPVAESAHSFY